MARLLGRDCPHAVADFLAAYGRLHDLCPHPFDGIPHLTATLRRRGLITALVTGKGAESCAITLRRFGLQDAFDCILTGSHVRNIKACNLRLLLEKYRLHPAEAVYIGDAPSDIEACRKTGICCLSAAWAASAAVRRLCERLNGGRVFRSVEALAACLDLLVEGSPPSGVTSQK